MSPVEIALGGLALLVSILAFAVGWACATARRERARRERLMRWIRGHLLLLRVECSHMSPEALSVITALEAALPTLARVDADALVTHLDKLRRKRVADILANVGAINAHAAQPPKGGAS